MQQPPNQLVDHFFRHESGKLIAVLVRFFGVQHLELVEDMVQSALAEALNAWKLGGVPDNPGAWIHRVAKNRVLDSLRREATFRRNAIEFAALAAARQQSRLEELFEEEFLQDNLLRMIFVCCHPDLPEESRIPLTLKTICGFNESEIAAGLLIRQEAVRKRIYRARKTLVRHRISMDLPPLDQLVRRLESVHHVLYLMFNEGYYSSGDNDAIRLDLCEEAARLCHLLTEHSACSTHTTRALLALMLLHASRFQSRVDQAGALILLEDQDRKLWDRRLMSRAVEYLSEAANVDRPTTYHFEAAIALQHCQAESFESTNWGAIVQLYDRLLEICPSPIYRLNQAIAIGKYSDPDAALEILEGLRGDPLLRNTHLLDAAIGEFCRERGDHQRARDHLTRSLALAGSRHDQAALQKRLDELDR